MSPFRRPAIFISYKSHDAQLARGIAEQLMASGIRVWFAEYEILLKRRDRFEQSITRGLRRARFGLAITNDRYIASKYCQLELRELLTRLDPGRVLEARSPDENETHGMFPKLRNSPHVVSPELDDVLRLVHEATDLTVEAAPGPPVSASAEPVGGPCLGHGYTLDSSGWDVVEEAEDRAAGGVIKGPVMRCSWSEFPIVANLFAGADPSPEARRRHRDTEDDREMYDALLDYLPRHLGRLSARVRGVHLLFHGELSQMAATYRIAGYWSRKYSVTLPHPDGHDPAEFVFTFGFFGPFRQFCRYAFAMDRLVGSLRWGNVP